MTSSLLVAIYFGLFKFLSTVFCSFQYLAWLITWICVLDRVVRLMDGHEHRESWSTVPTFNERTLPSPFSSRRWLWVRWSGHVKPLRSPWNVQVTLDLFCTTSVSWMTFFYFVFLLESCHLLFKFSDPCIHTLKQHFLSIYYWVCVGCLPNSHYPFFAESSLIMFMRRWPVLRDPRAWVSAGLRRHAHPVPF